MGRPLERENQIQQIRASAIFQCGEPFTSPTIASLLNTTVGQARDLCNHMVVFGELTKYLTTQKQGSSRSGTMMYQKPVSKLARVSWRKRSNHELGIQPLNILGSPRHL